MGILLQQFKAFSLELTDSVKQSILEVARSVGQAVRYVESSSLSKEELVRELLRREGVTEGLVCVLSCVEPCRSYEIRGNRQTKHIDLASAVRKCLHYYLYYIDSRLGLCHVRIQSWLPFTVHVCVNGREWLCRELSRAGIAFTRSDNCLLRVGNLEQAQELLNSQPWADWTGMLDDLLERSCPVLHRLPISDRSHEYYWSADETEWASDVMFRSPQALKAVYPTLLRHALTTFSSREVMRFLGRTRMPKSGGVDRRFNGQVVSDLAERPEGIRVKHRVNHNAIKMYDKQGSVLRVETTINDARDLRVFRASEANPEGPKAWLRLRKGVVDLPRRAQISQAANQRYLAALSEATSATPLGKLADAIRAPVIEDGRRYRGLNPLSGQDAQLAEIMLRGEFALHGFRNRDVRERLHSHATDAEERRRQSTRVSRLLNLFRRHGLIQKITGTHRYQLTARGRRTLPPFLAARQANSDELHKLAV